MNIVQYALIFGENQDSTLAPPYIRVKATGSTNWNDFHFNYEALIEIVPSDNREKFSAAAYVMPTEDSENARRLGSWLASTRLNDRPQAEVGFANLDETGAPRFLSLFDGHSFYQALNSWCVSHEEKYQILAKINDTVYLRHGNVFPRHTLSQLMLKQGFKLGVLRSSNAFRALRRGWRTLHAQPIEALNDARSKFEFSTELHGFTKSRHNLNVSFRDVQGFEDRIHCLIGINGTGKTRLLRELTLELSKPFTEQEAVPVFLSEETTEAESENAYIGPKYNRLLVFSADAEVRYPTGVRTDTAFEYQYFNLINGAPVDSSLSRDSTTLSTDQISMTSVVVALLRDKETFPHDDAESPTRFRLLQSAVIGHVDMDLLHLPLIPTSTVKGAGVHEDESGGQWVHIHDLIYLNEQRRLELTAQVDEEKELGFFTRARTTGHLRKIFLSSGQKLFFAFALRLISSIDTGTLVLIDEPETHLHPKLICDLMSLLYDVLEATKSIAIIATHSAYVVRETPTHCVHVINFSDESGGVRIHHVRLRTLGASIDSLSQAVFGDATVEKYHERIAKEIALSSLSEDDIIKKYQKILSPELLAEIQIQRDGEE